MYVHLYRSLWTGLSTLGNHCKTVQNALFYLFYSIKGTGAIFKKFYTPDTHVPLLDTHTQPDFSISTTNHQNPSCTQPSSSGLFLLPTTLCRLTLSFPGLITRLLSCIRWDEFLSKCKGFPRSFTSCSSLFNGQVDHFLLNTAWAFHFLLAGKIHCFHW